VGDAARRDNFRLALSIHAVSDGGEMWRSLVSLVIVEHPSSVKNNDDLLVPEKTPYGPATPLEPLVEVT
jgi:hypothetical protein